eukprot:scaffold309575_cov33-Prasinocladus_malaysianus.AAC.1
MEWNKMNEMERNQAAGSQPSGHVKEGYELASLVGAWSLDSQHVVVPDEARGLSRLRVNELLRYRAMQVSLAEFGCAPTFNCCFANVILSRVAHTGYLLVATKRLKEFAYIAAIFCFFIFALHSSPYCKSTGTVPVLSQPRKVIGKYNPHRVHTVFIRHLGPWLSTFKPCLAWLQQTVLTQAQPDHHTLLEAVFSFIEQDIVSLI